jgi:cytochrome c biogenesis protein CcmG/thiol:disulfide interchange protein DsbE
MVDALDAPAPDPAAPTSGPRRRPVLVVAVVVAVLLGFLVVVFAMARGGGGDTADTPLLGRPAPPVLGETLDGAAFDLSTRRGSWVVLNFFASWCDPCRQEAPELGRFAAAQQAEGGAEVVGVVYNDSAAEIRSFLDTYGGGAYPAVLDPAGGIAISFGVVKVPETWIIDPNGVVRARIIATVDAATLTALLRDAQQGSAP